MKKAFILFALLVVGTVGFAQQFTVVSFKETGAPVDLQQYNDRNKKSKAALIKVVTPMQNLTYTAGSNFYKQEYMATKGEMWLYVRPDSQWLKIIHPEVGQLQGNGVNEGAYQFPVAIKAGKAYRMELSNPMLSPKMGRVTFRCNIDGAEVFVGKDIIPVGHINDGSLTTAYINGKMPYRVSHPSCSDVEGTATVDSLCVVDVTLRPMLCLVTVNSMPEAVIKVDGEVMGRGKATLDISRGNHTLSVSMDGYHDTSLTASLENGTMRSFDLMPRRIMGSVEVTSVPKGAKVTVDGRQVGVTPLSVPNLESGLHEILLEAPAALYSSYRSSFYVNGRETAKVDHQFDRRDHVSLAVGAQIPSLLALNAGANIYFQRAAGLTVELGGFFAFPTSGGYFGSNSDCPVGLYEQIGFSFHPKARLRVTPLVETDFYKHNDGRVAMALNGGVKVVISLNEMMHLYALPKIGYMGWMSPNVYDRSWMINLQAGIMMF